MTLLLRSIVEYLQLIESCDRSTFLLSIIIACLLSIKYFTTRSRQPPGPRGIPFLGFLPFMNENNTYMQLDRLAKKYGPVYKLQMGVRNFVVIADYVSMCDALKRDVFSARPVTPFTDFFDGCGIVNTSGEVWKKQRKFAHNAMRKFGVHLNKMKDRNQIQNVLNFEITSLLNNLKKENGTGIDLQVPLGTCSANIIASLLMNVRFESTDPKFRRLLFLMDEGFRLFSVIASVNFIPALQYVPGVKKAYKTLMKNRDEMFSFLRETVDNHKKSIRNDIQDFIDIYLEEIDNSSIDNKKKFNENQLYQILADLLTSGMETTRTTLQWFIFHVASNDDVKRKIQAEIDLVVGENRLPNLNDMGSLPYTEATIWETQRISNVLAISPAHSTSKDTTLNGYFIPRDTIVLPLLYSVHNDEKIWKNPTEFDPTRFLSDDGTKLKRNSHFIPFGIGRRQCLGLLLARMELFSIGCSILHQFDVSLPSDFDIEKMSPIATTTLSPPPHKICISSRRSVDIY